MSVTTSPSRPEMSFEVAAEREAREVLRACVDTAQFADATFERVPFGLSNVAWCATSAAGSSAFVRLAVAETERLGADHRSECRVLETVARAGIAPPVVRCDPTRRVLVTRWIEAVAPPTEPEQHGIVATLLARLHACAIPADVREVDFEHQAHMLERLLPPARRDPALEQVGAQVFERLRATRSALVLCHHDLNPHNLVWDRDRRPWFVDWEYAGRGDAALDLASYASQHDLPAHARERLLEHYLAAGGAADARRLDLACWAFDYVQWLWYAATLDLERAVAGRTVLETRAKRLQTALRARASSVLRCDNSRFEA
jgi:thiamine kinase